MWLGIFLSLISISVSGYAFFNFDNNDISMFENLSMLMAFVVMGLVVLSSLGIYLLRTSIMSKVQGWPHVQGSIDSYQINKNIFGTTIRIKYFYYINDIQYQNDNFDIFSKFVSLGHINASPSLRDIKEADDLNGKMIKVYFNPHKVYQSCLSSETYMNTLFAYLPPILVIATSIFLLTRILVGI